MRVRRIVLRVIGWLLVAGALAVAVREAMIWAQSGEWAPIAAGQLWFDIHRDSLQLVQPAIERYILPALWDPVILTVLQWPAWAVLGVPGLVLAWLADRPRRTKPKFR
ncbi:MAG: hypothetical protein WEB85_04455 [Dongiaceae bacterium]